MELFNYFHEDLLFSLHYWSETHFVNTEGKANQDECGGALSFDKDLISFVDNFLQSRDIL